MQPQLRNLSLPGLFGFVTACGAACSRPLAADMSGLLLPQYYMSDNKIADGEDRKNERIEPEIRKP
jgi:hypothetical protein